MCIIFKTGEIYIFFIVVVMSCALWPNNIFSFFFFSPSLM